MSRSTRGGGVETVGEGEGEGPPQPHQRPVGRLEDDAGGPARANGSMAGPVSRGRRTADHAVRRGRLGHGRPVRVAVISWLRPPERGRWLTDGEAGGAQHRTELGGGREVGGGPGQVPVGGPVGDQTPDDRDDLRNQMRWPTWSSPLSGSATSRRLIRPPGRTTRPNSPNTDGELGEVAEGVAAGDPVDRSRGHRQGGPVGLGQGAVRCGWPASIPQDRSMPKGASPPIRTGWRGSRRCRRPGRAPGSRPAGRGPGPTASASGRRVRRSSCG